MPHPHRWRRFLRVLGVAALLLALAAVAARPSLERALRARLVAEGTRRGFEVTVETVRLGLWPPVRLHKISIEKAGRVRLDAADVDVWWKWRPRVEIADAVLRGPFGLTVDAEWTVWDVLRADRDHLRLALARPANGLVLDRTLTPGRTTWSVQATDLATGRLLEVRRADRALLDGGMLRGSFQCLDEAGELRCDLDATAQAARLPALAPDAAGPDATAGLDPPMGEPVQVGLQATGAWNQGGGALEIPHYGVTIADTSLSGTLSLRDLGRDPAIELSLDVEKLDFARLLRASGLPPPEDLAPAGVAAAGAGAAGDPAGGPPLDLGTASLAATAAGKLSDPASFVVTQNLRFTPPARMPQAIARLRGDFVQEVALRSGGRRGIEVSPASPDFIPLAQVPPLFRRALLIAEDSGFYSHPGIDLREVPPALLADLARGGAVRGASTITQQLAKNLFLSRDKSVGRKLQELSMALLLESALGKDRILEIYVNVIEWGPDLFGLRPAARAYFGREPADLTPAQTAFLVSLIPAPVKYQVSFKDGTPGPGLRQLMDALLAKLRSVDALSEEEYRRALEEPVVVQGRGAPPAAAPEPAQSPAG